MPGCLCFHLMQHAFRRPGPAHSDMTACLCAFHFLSDVAPWMSTVTPEKSTRTRRISPALANSSKRLNIPLMISSSQSGRINYCVQGRVGRQRPKGSLHLLVHCHVETSATAEQHACIRANPCLHLVARLSHAPDPFCPWRFSRMSRRRRRRRARLGTKVETPSGPILNVALCVADELLAHH